MQIVNSIHLDLNIICLWKYFNFPLFNIFYSIYHIAYDYVRFKDIAIIWNSVRFSRKNRIRVIIYLYRKIMEKNLKMLGLEMLFVSLVCQVVEIV